jgi:hypothetical protein
MSRFLNTLASLTSVAAFAGVVYWGVSLSQMDPNDIPVIKKAQGPARIAPADPGGEQASFQGLSVNEVQSAGGASKPADKVYLAPKPRPFQPEDVAGLTIQKTSHVVAEPDRAPILKDADLKPISVSATGELITDTTPKSLTTDAATTPATVKTTGEITTPSLKPTVSRPAKRPKDLRATTPVKTATKTPTQTSSAIPVGTTLVQLGAFDADAVATVQWNNLAARHKDLLGGKKPVIQKAKKGSKTFYRLRVQGFKNKAAANNFCTALKARGTDCIPVTMR